jgi:hypothetical protein
VLKPLEEKIKKNKKWIAVVCETNVCTLCAAGSIVTNERLYVLMSGTL